ncbi:Enoyl-CoA hydratase/carnithine racemase [Parasphingorhabdus marina DSM 22363]|uniref:Enoyl-CoA hydratase/carnithine racemase n=1 Tax=Parasphingorhabdus marina DSM 22363 TaxID=1123272 RepID=A0A1N6DB52_9SPHN|nr:enoyl-CoA hydratase/isomerase family protein [Parasphingorhabdus marina]SIN67884.1 Enoyl-CoA hydratase/carnithine racemase [Parasphingorhabdus marina DSM 22363]
MAYNYALFKVSRQGRLATVTIENPPVNLITVQMYEELQGLTAELESDPDLTVVLFKSADPDFFIAHFDVELILSFPVEGEAEKSTEPNPFHVLCRRFRTMDKVTIAQIEGRIGGGGNEIASNMDMRFGVKGRTRISQMEVPLGILPGGTGTQTLPDIVGRGRALEIIVGAEDIDAETAEKWGYLNRIFAPDEIGEKVEQLTRKIAGYPPDAVRLAKQSVNNATADTDAGLSEEAYLFQQLIRTPDARANMTRFLEIGGQTRDGELRVDELVRQLGSE